MKLKGEDFTCDRFNDFTSLTCDRRLKNQQRHHEYGIRTRKDRKIKNLGAVLRFRDSENKIPALTDLVDYQDKTCTIVAEVELNTAIPGRERRQRRRKEGEIPMSFPCLVVQSVIFEEHN